MTAVLFDFSGTLFRIESSEDWLRAVLDGAGVSLSGPELAETARALEAAGALPGGAPPV
ncbi:hydrolase, partial [Streptomyces sp. NPDC005047]